MTDSIPQGDVTEDAYGNEIHGRIRSRLKHVWLNSFNNRLWPTARRNPLSKPSRLRSSNNPRAVKPAIPPGSKTTSFSPGTCQIRMYKRPLRRWMRSNYYIERKKFERMLSWPRPCRLRLIRRFTLY